MRKQTPTQQIKKWISKFITKPNPVFGNLPPCPFAQKAMLEEKVDFVEVPSTADWRTLYQFVWNFDAEHKDVLCLIAEPDHFTAHETMAIARELNERFMPRDVVILEDHPDIAEKVKHVTLNNGEYTLFLAQGLSKLNRHAKMLESGPYYKNWSKSYLESVKGFRHPSGSRS